jgi:hypothetical protein
MTLTAKIVRDAKPTGRTEILWDGVVKGLGLRTTKAGVKSYVLSYRVDGSKRLLTLGREFALSLSEARELAGEKSQYVRQGGDPLRDKAERREPPTVSEGVERYLTEYIPNRISLGQMTERTKSECPSSNCLRQMAF